ncbi:UNVERIFIED_CONTAM: cytochrome [Sesamum angustifolium]|uniref:Cytochrome n=1 Tax=Sesamum angustifolium TaxID=2727405 RepID=A0AAW2N7E9_9LAMI
MAMIILCIIFSIISIQLLARKLHQKQGKKTYHPIGGTVFHQLVNFNRLHDYMTDLAGKHKTYRLISPFRSEVYTSDPANVEYMLKTNFENYGKGWYNYSILKDLLGDGIFTVDGEKWREQRKVSSYESLDKVSEAAISNKPIDVQDLFMKATLDSIFRVAFGVDLDTMCGSNEEGAKFSNAFDDASALTLWRVVDEFVYKLISSKSEKLHESQDDPCLKKEDILSRFLQLSETDPKYLRDIILNFIIAGKDTTATTLSWFIYMLCKHPLVQEKVAKEIKDVTDSKDVVNISDFATSVSEENLEKMHYLHAALTETLRLYPAVPVDAKVCLSDDTMPDGYSVKKGDMVAYQAYAMGRMRFIWDDDAEDFRPERWIDENGCFQQESPFKFTAFQMKIFSAVLLRFFVFKLSHEGQTVKYRTMINLHIDGGLSVRAFHRSDMKLT